MQHLSNFRFKKFKILGELWFALFIFCSSAIANDNGFQYNQNYVDLLIKKSRDLKLGLSKEWLKLGYYDKSLFGSYSSKADGKGFFSSPIGKKNPQVELEATLKTFFDQAKEGNDDYHGQCHFPARKRYLVKKLAIDESKLPKVNCDLFNKFVKIINPDGIALVFSSYYLDNPASTFGHSFLRFFRKDERTGKRSKNELLDYGINYTAHPGPIKGPLFAIGGMLGWFPGKYSHLPYYYKVREYNDFEARDLWTYELNLTDKEVYKLLEHLWELSTTYFDYFFFDENCALHILMAIEAVAPRLDITSRLAPWVIPSDTILEVNKIKGLVKDISYRPSVQARFFSILNSLKSNEKQEFMKLIKHNDVEKINKSLSENSLSKILDSYIEYIEYKFPDQIVDNTKESSKWKYRALLKRSALKSKRKEIKIKAPKIKEPHSGHDSHRIGATFGYDKYGEKYIEIDQRFALHDPLDSTIGYPKNGQVEFFHITGRYSEKRKLELEKWSFIQVRAYNTLNKIDKKKSNYIDLGIRRDRTKDCLNECYAGFFNLGYGGTFSFDKKNNYIFYLLADIDLSYSQKYLNKSIRLGIGPRAGTIMHFTDKSKFRFDFLYSYAPFSNDLKFQQLESEYRYTLKKNLAIGFKSRLSDSHWDSSGSIYFYY